jgi:hypothetical protein
MISLKVGRFTQCRRRRGVSVSVCFYALMLAAGCNGGKTAQPTQPTAASKNQVAWWAGDVPSSGFAPADANPDFDKYLVVSAPIRQAKNGDYVSDDVVAKGWDKTLKTFYMTLDIKPDNPIRVQIPGVPSTLPIKTITPCTTSWWKFWVPRCGQETEPSAAGLHSDCKVLDVVDGKVLDVTGKVGLAVTVGTSSTLGYIVGLPGSRLDVSGFADKPFPFAGRQWRAKAGKEAYIVVTPEELILKNVEEVH